MSKIADMIAGWFRVTGENETSLVSFKDDPPKHRMGVLRSELGRHGGRGLGCVSYNIVDADGREDEHVLKQGKVVEDGGRVTGSGGGEYYIGLKRPGGGSQDGDMDDVLVANHHDGFRFKLPVYAPNLTPGAGGGDGGFLFTMKHPNGRTWLACQGDGNFVLYINLERFNYNTGFPVWSSGTVMLDEHEMPTEAFQKLLAKDNKTFIP